MKRAIEGMQEIYVDATAEAGKAPDIPPDLIIQTSAADIPLGDGSTPAFLQKGHIKLPVAYDADTQMVYDDNGTLVLEVRGWGFLSRLATSEGQAEIFQNQLGDWISERLNSSGTPLNPENTG